MELPEPGYLPWQVETLQLALELKQKQRLPHAVLIDTTSDRDISGFITYLSMILLCDQPDGLKLCHHCEPCRRLPQGTYSDYSMLTLEIDDRNKKLKKNISIEQVRKLTHEVSLTHQYDRLKIGTIYPAETLNKNSANALLKTLEEPSPQVLLILATHNIGRVPITLRSRCQHWHINPPTIEQAGSWLQAQEVDAETTETYLQFANGDPVLALELRDNDYAALVSSFKARLAKFLRGELAVSELCQGIMSSEVSIIRRLVTMTLSAYCYQTSGVGADGQPRDGQDRLRAQRLLDLRARAQRQLLVEENNLDLQLQLEDVLISLKQIITRRPV